MEILSYIVTELRAKNSKYVGEKNFGNFISRNLKLVLEFNFQEYGNGPYVGTFSNKKKSTLGVSVFLRYPGQDAKTHERRGGEPVLLA